MTKPTLDEALPAAQELVLPPTPQRPCRGRPRAAHQQGLPGILFGAPPRHSLESIKNRVQRCGQIRGLNGSHPVRVSNAVR